jgi:TetR/AcrR family transcriptional regulator
MMGIQERKEREKERRRNEIIDAAEKVIFANGIDKATVENIAAEAEISKATVYLYFSSKEEIYFAISMRGQQILFKMLENAVSKVKNTREKVLTFLKTFVNFKKEFSNYFNAFFYFLSNEVEFEKEKLYVEENRKRHEKYLNSWKELIQEGKKEGVIREDLNEINVVLLLWMQLIGFLRIYSVMKPRLKESFDIEEESLLNDYFDLVLQGMVK